MGLGLGLAFFAQGAPQARFDDLQIPGAKVIPEEAVDQIADGAEFEGGECGLDRGQGVMDAVGEPAIFDRFEAGVGAIAFGLSEDDATAGLPDLIAKTAAFFKAWDIDIIGGEAVLVGEFGAEDLEADILGVSCGGRKEAVAEGIGPVRLVELAAFGGDIADRVLAFDDIRTPFDGADGIKAIAPRFGHDLAVFVLDRAVDHDMGEGGGLFELHADHDHPGHPQGEDIAACHEGGRRVEKLKIGGIIGPTQGGKRPDLGGEPGIQDIGVLDKIVGATDGAAGGFGVSGIAVGDDGLGIVGDGKADRIARGVGLDRGIAGATVPDRDPVSPPDLAGDTPVGRGVEPAEVIASSGFGEEGDLAFVVGLAGQIDERLHLHEPLAQQEGFDHGAASVAVGDFVGEVFDLDEIAAVVEGLDDGLSPVGGAFQTCEGSSFLVEGAIGTEEVDHRQVMAQTAGVVMGVVGGGDFDGSGSLFGIGEEGIAEDRDRAIHERQKGVLADHRREGLEAWEVVEEAGFQSLDPFGISGFAGQGETFFQGGFRIGMDGDGGISEHGFGAGGGDFDKEALFTEDRVAEIPKLGVDGLIDEFVVGEGGLDACGPVDQAFATVDQAFVEEGEEDVTNGFGKAGGHGELGAFPVEGGAEAFELSEDPGFVEVFPRPDPFEHGLSAEIVAGESFFLPEAAFDDGLGGDTCVIGTGHPEGRKALHPGDPGEHILDAIVQGVAEVQSACDIGQRDHDGVGATRGVDRGVEEAIVLAPTVPRGFDRRRVKGLGFTARRSRGEGLRRGGSHRLGMLRVEGMLGLSTAAGRSHRLGGKQGLKGSDGESGELNESVLEELEVAEGRAGVFGVEDLAGEEEVGAFGIGVVFEGFGDPDKGGADQTARRDDEVGFAAFGIADTKGDLGFGVGGMEAVGAGERTDVDAEKDEVAEGGIGARKKLAEGGEEDVKGADTGAFEGVRFVAVGEAKAGGEAARGGILAFVEEEGVEADRQAIKAKDLA